MCAELHKVGAFGQPIFDALTFALSASKAEAANIFSVTLKDGTTGIVIQGDAGKFKLERATARAPLIARHCEATTDIAKSVKANAERGARG